MIIWRKGLAGFVGRSKRLIKGFFSPRYSETSETILPPDRSIGLLSIIQSIGSGANSRVTSQGVGVSCSIASTVGLQSIVQSRGKGLDSQVTEAGIGLKSQI